MTRPTTLEGAATTHREIVAGLATAQKSNRGAGGYSRWVNRPVGRHLAAAAFRAGLTPNGVTAVSATLSALGIVLVATVPPVPWLGVVVALLLALGYAFDSADGQLARLTGTGSRAGEWLDHVVDCAKLAVIHVAVLIAWFRFSDLPDAMLLVPLAYGAQSSVFFFALILSEQLRRAAPGARRPRGDDGAPVLRSLVVLPADYGVLCVAFLVLGLPAVFTAVYTALMVANVLFLAAGLVRWYREMRALP